MKQKKYDKKIVEKRERVNKKKLFTLIPREISEDNQREYYKKP